VFLIDLEVRKESSVTVVGENDAAAAGHSCNECSGNTKQF